MSLSAAKAKAIKKLDEDLEAYLPDPEPEPEPAAATIPNVKGAAAKPAAYNPIAAAAKKAEPLSMAAIRTALEEACASAVTDVSELLCCPITHVSDSFAQTSSRNAPSPAAGLLKACPRAQYTHGGAALAAHQAGGTNVPEPSHARALRQSMLS